MRKSYIKLIGMLLLIFVVSGIAGIQAAEAGATNKVLAFYYAWYDPSSFGPGVTPFQPQNTYFSTNADTIRRQVKTAKAAGIDGFIQSWYGPNPNQQTEPNFKTLLDIAQQEGFVATVHFEAVSPFFDNDQDRIDALKVLVSQHAKHPAFMKMDGKPVIFFWANWLFTVGEWQTMRDQVDPNRETIWIAEGGHDKYLGVFDGLHLYNVAWSSDPGGVSQRWAGITRGRGDFYWAATAMPGFDNTLVQTDRKSRRDRDNGSYLTKSFQGAVASDPDILLLTSFNEWAEGSNIEPAKEFGNQYLNQMRQLSAGYKGVSPDSFPPIPAWGAAATETPPPSWTPAPVDTPAATPTLPATQIPTIVPTEPLPTALPTDAPPPPTDLPVPTAVPATDVPATIEVVAIATESVVIAEVATEAATIPPTDAPPTEAVPTLIPTYTNTPEAQPTATPQAIADAELPIPATAMPVPDQAYPVPVPSDDSIQNTDGYLIYVVKETDTVDSIALRYGVTAETLRTLNNLAAGEEAAVGRPLILGQLGNTDPAVPIDETNESDVAILPTPGPTGAIVYTVEAGETVDSIAAKFGLVAADIRTLNSLSADALILTGDQLLLGYIGEDGAVEPVVQPTSPPPPTVAIAPTPDPNGRPTPQPDGSVIYVVEEGDNVYYIADRFDLEPGALFELNGLTLDSLLVVGQPFLLGYLPPPDNAAAPDDAEESAVPDTAIDVANIEVPARFQAATLRDDGTLVHAVEEGDTAISIAIQYGYETMDDFYAASGLDATIILFVGQEIPVGTVEIPTPPAEPQEPGGSTDQPTAVPTTPPEPTLLPTLTATPQAELTPVAIADAVVPAATADATAAPILPTNTPVVLMPSGDAESETNTRPTPIIIQAAPDGDDADAQDGGLFGGGDGEDGSIVPTLFAAFCSLLVLGLVFGYLWLRANQRNRLR